MSEKTGVLSRQERLFAKAYAESGNRKEAAEKAGYKGAAMAACRQLAKPHVLAEIARVQQERLAVVVLPLAVNCVQEILTNTKAPAGARIQAAKLVFDRTLGAQDALGGKEPHEMTGSELADAIAKLEAMAASKARPIEDATVVDDTPGGDIFS